MLSQWSLRRSVGAPGSVVAGGGLRSVSPPVHRSWVLKVCVWTPRSGKPELLLTTMGQKFAFASWVRWSWCLPQPTVNPMKISNQVNGLLNLAAVGCFLEWSPAGRMHTFFPASYATRMMSPWWRLWSWSLRMRAKWCQIGMAHVT